jgi:hypothetical protein
MSRHLHHLPPLPIDIHYDREYGVKPEDMGGMLTALSKCPNRIRGITLKAPTADLDKFFQVTKRPFPALESLSLSDRGDNKLKIPATFLEGSDLHLRSLTLRHIPLTCISRFLMSPAALTCLVLVIDTDVGPPPMMSLLLSHLQGMPCLDHLDLDMHSRVYDVPQQTTPEERFPLSKLTFFHYRGHSAYLNTLVAGFEAPSLLQVDIGLSDATPPPIMHLSRLIEDIREPYHAFQIVLEHDSFFFLLLSESEDEYHFDPPPRFRLFTDRFPNRFPESIMQMSSAFSAKLTTMQKLIVVHFHGDDDDFYDDDDDEDEDENDDDELEGFIPWRTFLLQFTSLETLELDGTDNLPIAGALHQGHGELNLAFLPALEEIVLCTPLFGYTPEYEDQPETGARELAPFQPFLSTRQQANRLVRVVWGPSSAYESSAHGCCA